MVLAAALVGDPLQGQQIAGSRSAGLCVLCHAMPGVPAVQAGTLGPDLAGVGARYTRAQLRERLVAPERFNPQTVMPSATRSEGLQRVAAARQGQGVLTPQQLEDVLAWLETLR
jgi:sulfur-oxidizing protein SoxX